MRHVGLAGLNHFKVRIEEVPQRPYPGTQQLRYLISQELVIVQVRRKL